MQNAVTDITYIKAAYYKDLVCADTVLSTVRFTNKYCIVIYSILFYSILYIIYKKHCLLTITVKPLSTVTKCIIFLQVLFTSSSLICPKVKVTTVQEILW